MTAFTITPNGPFSLAAAADFAGGFAAGIGAHQTASGILMTFPVEGWRQSAAVEIEGRTVRPFPRPQRLLEAGAVPGLSQVKVERLHALANAAIDGSLDTERLRSLPEAAALEELQRLPGVGPWSAQAILTRGCGVADAVPLAEEISRTAVAWFYGLPGPPDDDTWTRISDAWRPYRMWATVLLHMAWRREQPSTPSYRQGA